MNTQKIRGQVIIQLSQYRFTKQLIADYETIALPAHTDKPRVQGGARADPTAAEVIRRAEPPRSIVNCKRWVEAIESTYEQYKADDPEHAMLMRLLFGLGEGESPHASCRERYRLMDMLNISESTLYRWREQIIQNVTLAAMHFGAIGLGSRENTIKDAQHLS
ncbi:hypothetical protein LJC07_01235 [Christensenellaceae bacterium OttesenSCG-928-L17]|nr:hypothetical protein [Christensenellaceae bacterium OttesenSCG-928-L17]